MLASGHIKALVTIWVASNVHNELFKKGFFFASCDKNDSTMYLSLPVFIEGKCPCLVVEIPTPCASMVGILGCLTIKNPLVNTGNPTNLLVITSLLNSIFIPMGFIPVLEKTSFVPAFVDFAWLILNIPLAFSNPSVPSIIPSSCIFIFDNSIPQ